MDPLGYVIPSDDIVVEVREGWTLENTGVMSFITEKNNRFKESWILYEKHGDYKLDNGEKKNSYLVQLSCRPTISLAFYCH